MYIRSSNLKNSQLDINDAIQGFECSQVTFLIPNIKNSHALFNQNEQIFYISFNNVLTLVFYKLKLVCKGGWKSVDAYKM